MKLVVKNLSPETTEEDLQRAFETYGEVLDTAVPVDRETGFQRGTGYVQMATREGGEEAIRRMHGSILKGSEISVHESTIPL